MELGVRLDGTPNNLADADLTIGDICFENNAFCDFVILSFIPYPLNDDIDEI